MSEPIVLKVRGKEYPGWKDVSIQLSLEQLASTFSMNMTFYFPGDIAKQPFFRGDSCEVSLYGKTIITGYIDSKRVSYDARSHSVSVTGRDRTGDLVDCSYTGKRTQFKNVTIDKAIKELCAPMGISVVVNADVGKPLSQVFSVDPGATIFSQIQQLCGYRGIMPISYGDGKLYLEQAGKFRVPDSLGLGSNIESADCNSTHEDRFSEYIVKGQGKVKKEDSDAKPVYNRIGRAYDSEIKRFRPLVIILDGEVTNADCQNRARWEAWTRSGRSRDFLYTVQGWKMSNGEPWPLNRLIHLKDPQMVLDEDLLIAGVNFVLDPSSGSTTGLTLCHPYAYVPHSEDQPMDVGKKEKKRSSILDEVLGGVKKNAVEVAKQTAQEVFDEIEKKRKKK
jgi:prophage tail gpP-like protein